ncbi:MAG: Gfo/Idh/MocA family oxidoreductase [Verrucomicrobiales bacterium]|jgi:myo-inositol 2-dehydrogenase / D-chiro-inositol 1-dehydrogenase|nr:Gfo/Idh/MocA family oxidoreductase [Verrucomicrobiales bacterium]MDP5004566.1 Gfo/Idh/MocA family oxidoreductase [Verrucomicrobiales bacterium]
MSEKKEKPQTDTTRRGFVKTAGTAAAATSVAAIGFPNVTFGAPNDRKLKIGVVGTGGRGGGAMLNALAADDNVELWAAGDLYLAEAEKKLAMVRKSPIAKDKLAEGLDGRVFSGIDSYKQVIDSGVDVILLTTPPAFRPTHFKAAVEAGIHAFVEKPCATDIAGVKDFLATSKIAAEKGLSVLCGFCYRYSEQGRALFERLHDGAIGDIVSVHSIYNAGPVKAMPDPSSRPDGMSDTEWQIANWYNFTWLSGDGIVEQGCHNVDRVAWAFQDARPVAAFGTGGRTRPNNQGNIYDHFSITYEYANNATAHVEWRQYLDSYNFTGDTIYGTKGIAKFGTSSAEILGENAWNWRKPRTPKSMYDLEHEEFFAAIRSGERKDDAEWIGNSTTLAILGRTACYSGKRITWDDMWAAEQKLVPDTIDMNGPLPIRPIRVPGVPETQDTIFPEDTQKA